MSEIKETGKQLLDLPRTEDGNVDPEAIKGTFYEKLLERVAKSTTLEKNASGKPVGPRVYKRKASVPGEHDIKKDIYFSSESFVDGPIQMHLVDRFYRFPDPEKGEMGGTRTYTKRVEFFPSGDGRRGAIKYDLSPEYNEPPYMRMKGGELAEFLNAMGVELLGAIIPESSKGEVGYKLR